MITQSFFLFKIKENHDTIKRTYVLKMKGYIMNDIKSAIELLNSKDISDMDLVYKEGFLTKLNHEQRVAATRKEGNFLVIAGPGSGKTHTLAYRVVYLVKNNVDPKSIVVITFTRKAGKELKDRINYLLPNTSFGFIGTFHAFSHHISTKLGNSSPISGFRLLDQEDDVQVHKLVMADFKSFNKKVKAKTLQKTISYCSNTQLTIRDYISKFDINELKSDVENIEEYKKIYEHYKVKHLLANYDDMITLVTKYLQGENAKKITGSFEYLMVDEYQDTNQMQLDFLKKLNIKNTMAIGDDFQGIYSFRGADHRIILNFFNDFKDACMIKLKENYRSTGEIVDYVSKTVERSDLGYKKSFRVVKKTSGKAEVVSGKSLEEHKSFILGMINEKKEETHALIYRYNKNRTVFEKAFIEENIDYTVYGGIRLLERKHIKDILAFLMVSLNRLDIVSFNRVLILLPGVGAKTSRRLIDSNLEDLSFLSKGKKDVLSRVKNLLDSKDSKEDLFRNVCKFYFSIYEHVESEIYTKDEIKEDFKLIFELLETYDSLNNFIINLILDPVVDMHKGKRPKVILTTIHSAKGLEFDNVYYFHTHDWYKNYDLESLEEDRRLFYVGISRAKQNLYIFDHTGYSRTFEEILRDFDNQATIIKEKEIEYTSKASGEAAISESRKEDDINLDKYETIETTLPSLIHQNTLNALSSELYMYFKKKEYKSYVSPLKVKLVKDEKVYIVSPDVFVLNDEKNILDGIYQGCPSLVVEVTCDDTRTTDMVKKLDLYMNVGIKEYWIVDVESKMVMVYTFKEKKILTTNIFIKNQIIKSNIFENLEIELNDLI